VVIAYPYVTLIREMVRIAGSDDLGSSVVSVIRHAVKTAKKNLLIAS
jgi:hypothetical protein